MLVYCLAYSSILKMETTCYSETPVDFHHFFFKFAQWGDGIQTGSTRHVGHFWPIVPAPGDCEDGESGPGSRPGLASEICGGQSGVGAGFLRVLRVPLPKPSIPPTSPPSSQSPGTVSRDFATS
jgi:hypothetical protein